MAQPELDLPPIVQLEQALAKLPPELDVARAALTALEVQVEGLPEEQRDLRVSLSGRAAELCGSVARISGMNEGVITEFSGYGGKFAKIAGALGVVVDRQVLPTNTDGKDLSSGKRHAAAL